MHEETFTVEHGFLVRSVVPKTGTPYQHRCPLDAFEAVAQAAGHLERFTLGDLQKDANVPHSQAATAFAFMKERGIVVPAGQKRHKAATIDAYLDAMTEYHALREGDAPEPGEEANA